MQRTVLSFLSLFRVSVRIRTNERSREREPPHLCIHTSFIIGIRINTACYLFLLYALMHCGCPFALDAYANGQGIREKKMMFLQLHMFIYAKHFWGLKFSLKKIDRNLSELIILVQKGEITRIFNALI